MHARAAQCPHSSGRGLSISGQQIVLSGSRPRKVCNYCQQKSVRRRPPMRSSLIVSHINPMNHMHALMSFAKPGYAVCMRRVCTLHSIILFSVSRVLLLRVVVTVIYHISSLSECSCTLEEISIRAGSSAFSLSQNSIYVYWNGFLRV